MSLSASGRLVRSVVDSRPREFEYGLALQRPSRILRSERWRFGATGPEVTVTAAFDGVVAWSSTVASQGMARGRDDAAYRHALEFCLQRDAAAYLALLLADPGPGFSANVAGDAEIAGAPAIALDFTKAAFSLRIFVDKSTLQPVLVSYLNRDPSEERDVLHQFQLYASNRVNVDGVLLPNNLKTVVDDQLVGEFIVQRSSTAALDPSYFASKR